MFVLFWVGKGLRYCSCFLQGVFKIHINLSDPPSQPAAHRETRGRNAKHNTVASGQPGTHSHTHGHTHTCTTLDVVIASEARAALQCSDIWKLTGVLNVHINLHTCQLDNDGNRTPLTPSGGIVLICATLEK